VCGQRDGDMDVKRESAKERKCVSKRVKMHIYLYVMDTIVLYVTSHGVSIHIRITKYNAKLARGAL